MISSQLPRDFVPDSTTHSEPDIIHGPSRTPSVYAPAAHAARDLGGQLVATLYFSVYHQRNSRKAPEGFTLAV